MSSAAEARRHIIHLTDDLPVGAKVKEILRLACRRTGFGARRVRALWNGEARVISAEEMDALRAATQRREAREEVERADYQALLVRLAALEKRAGVARESAAVGRQEADEHGRNGRTLAGGDRL